MERFFILKSNLFDVMEIKRTVAEKLVPSLIAGISVMVVFYFFKLKNAGFELLFAALGSSAFLISVSPHAESAKLRNVLIGYFYGGIFGIVGEQLLAHGAPLYLSAFVAVFLTSLFMLISKSPHPPAAGAALSFVIYRRASAELLTLYLAILLLIVVGKFLVYAYRKELPVREFKREFSR